MTAPLVFLDTETTGVHPGRRAWEVAMIRREDNGNSAAREFFIGDVDLSNADPFGLKIGRFYDRHPLYNGLNKTDHWRTDQAPFGGHTDYRITTEAFAARTVEEWTRGAHIVGAVPNFDTETLAPLLREHGLVPAWHYHLIDVETLVVGWLSAGARTGLECVATLPWDSENLSRTAGVDPTEFARHTAMGDVQWAMALYDAVMGGAR